MKILTKEHMFFLLFMLPEADPVFITSLFCVQKYRNKEVFVPDYRKGYGDAGNFCPAADAIDRRG